MNNQIFYILFSLLAMTACSKEKDSEKKVQPTVFSKSLNSIKSGMGTVKGFVIEPDSIKDVRKLNYSKLMISQYPEYNDILHFFNTPSIFLREEKGKFFRIKDLKITDNGSVIYNVDQNLDEVKYFYVASDNYYVYTFDLTNKDLPLCTAVRRIKMGKFSQPVHDLQFKDNQLIREDFVADVSKDFFDKDGQQYFKINKKIDGSEIENLYNLGPKQDF